MAQTGLELFDYLQPTDLLNTDLGWKEGTTAKAAPAAVGSYNPYMLATVLSRLATAFSPEQYNRWGQKVPTWQEKLAGQVGTMSQGQMMMQALQAPQQKAPQGGGLNPFLLYMLMQGGR